MLARFLIKILSLVSILNTDYLHGTIMTSTLLVHTIIFYMLHHVISHYWYFTEQSVIYFLSLQTGRQSHLFTPANSSPLPTGRVPSLSPRTPLNASVQPQGNIYH